MNAAGLCRRARACASRLEEFAARGLSDADRDVLAAELYVVVVGLRRESPPAIRNAQRAVVRAIEGTAEMRSAALEVEDEDGDARGAG